MDVLDAISYMLLFVPAGPFLDKLFLKQGDTVNRHHQGNRSDDSDGLTLFAETKNSTKFNWPSILTPAPQFRARRGTHFARDKGFWEMVELHQDKVMIGWPSFLAAISVIHRTFRPFHLT